MSSSELNYQPYDDDDELSDTILNMFLNLNILIIVTKN